MRIRYPIRYKFLSVTTLLLVFSVVAYLFLASHIFRRDKIELVFDLNRGAVTGFSSEVDTLFRGIADKMKLAAVLTQDPALAKSSATILDDLLSSDSGIVYLAASYGFAKLDRDVFADPKFAETYALEKDYYQKTLPAARPIPFDEIQAKGEAVWNATIEDGPLLIGFAKAVSASGNATRAAGEPAPFAMIAFVRADRLQESFAKSRINEVMAVNEHGQILAHARPEKLADESSMSAHPLFKDAREKGLKTGVLSYQDGDREMLGAHSASLGGKIYVLSQIDGKLAFSAVERLVQRSLIFAMIALTLAFLAAIFFSRSLTRPIQALVDAMKQVSKGKLETRIDVGTRDEIALLATSFNSMLTDLRASREELEKANKELEQKVKDRTRRLEEQNVAVKKAQEALLQSTRMATVGEVAGRAAHEVLNPLTSIVTRLEKVRSRIQGGAVQEVALVSDIVKSWNEEAAAGGFEKLVESWQKPSGIDERQSLWEEDFDNIKHVEQTVREELQAVLTDMDFLLRETSRINKIVQNMRELTLVKGDLKVVSAKSLVQEALRIMADLGEHQGIEFVEDFQETEDSVKLDPDEFIQCATNLLRNSIQAVVLRRQREPGLRGQIKVTLRAHDTHLTIDFADNGVGISAENQDKLFEIQFSTKPKDEGTGLGLTITRRFIRAFGGDIELHESGPNAGTVFRVQLPLVENRDVSSRKGMVAA